MCVGLDGVQYQEDLRLTEQKVEQQRKIAERAEKDLEPVDVSLPGVWEWKGGRGLNFVVHCLRDPVTLGSGMKCPACDFCCHAFAALCCLCPHYLPFLCPCYACRGGCRSWTACLMR